MKKITILCFGLLLTLSVNAQKMSKQEALDLMADDTCKCVADKELTASDSMEEKEMALGICLLTSFNKHKSKSKYFSKKTLDDIEMIGEEVGMAMVSICAEDFLSIFSSDELLGAANDEGDVVTSNVVDEMLSIKVELTGMSNDVISYVTTKDDFEKNHTFLITDEFEGYELLKKSNFEKSFVITYKEVKWFDLSEKQYITKKIITKLEAI